jgi:hypothetical protein
MNGRSCPMESKMTKYDKLFLEGARMAGMTPKEMEACYREIDAAYAKVRKARKPRKRSDAIARKAADPHGPY